MRFSIYRSFVEVFNIIFVGDLRKACINIVYIFLLESEIPVLSLPHDVLNFKNFDATSQKVTM